MTPDPMSTENRLRLLLAHVLDVLDRNTRITACAVCAEAREAAHPEAKPRPVASAEAS